MCLKMLAKPRKTPWLINGFADHEIRHEKWLAIIGNINPTFSDKPSWWQAVDIARVNTEVEGASVPVPASPAKRRAFFAIVLHLELAMTSRF